MDGTGPGAEWKWDRARRRLFPPHRAPEAVHRRPLPARAGQRGGLRLSGSLGVYAARIIGVGSTRSDTETSRQSPVSFSPRFLQPPL